MSLPATSLCDERGCENQGWECAYPDGSDGGRYCPEHAVANGFCMCCGAFSAGIESFSFGPSAGYCDTCWLENEDLFPRDDQPDDEGWEDEE